MAWRPTLRHLCVDSSSVTSVPKRLAIWSASQASAVAVTGGKDASEEGRLRRKWNKGTKEFKDEAMQEENCKKHLPFQGKKHMPFRAMLYSKNMHLIMYSCVVLKLLRRRLVIKA